MTQQTVGKCPDRTDLSKHDLYFGIRGCETPGGAGLGLTHKLTQSLTFSKQQILHKVELFGPFLPMPTALKTF